MIRPGSLFLRNWIWGTVWTSLILIPSIWLVFWLNRRTSASAPLGSEWPTVGLMRPAWSSVRTLGAIGSRAHRSCPVGEWEFATVGVANVIQVLFVVIAAVGLAAALGTILARNLVRAALYLVAFFFMVACQFVLLEAEFLAALQVLVYIGAVAIILMFGIMLTRNIQGDDPASTPSAWRASRAGRRPGRVSGSCLRNHVSARDRQPSVLVDD